MYNSKRRKIIRKKINSQNRKKYSKTFKINGRNRERK